MPPIPVIDLFAGPGGLGEGFSAYHTSTGEPGFEIRLSIEKDPVACRTLKLRSFLRKFPDRALPREYYQFLEDTNRVEHERLSALYAKHPEMERIADREVWEAELGKNDRIEVRRRIDEALRDTSEWVLIGGPPCQAYSLAGRSRNRGNPGYRPDADKRQFLYIEYLQILADHQPGVFVMENVKGLLSATIGNEIIFRRMIEDLHHPAEALKREARPVRRRRDGRRNSRYTIHSLVKSDLFDGSTLSDFIVRMEQHGIPQARHRVIVLGVREDLGRVEISRLPIRNRVSAGEVLEGLPALRSALSGEPDSIDTWIVRLQEALKRRWIASAGRCGGELTHGRLVDVIRGLREPAADLGGEFVRCRPTVSYEPGWYLDRRLDGVVHHRSRSHIVQDLYRYLYAACYAEIHERSPRLKDFPPDLHPNHHNVDKALNGGHFSDRFRVQLWDQPATTVTSHISKDGHYYIHPDPAQCRSLTVREAARLQTFPDNYFFCGSRTAQYIQVGNAVPPLLARQIAEIVFDIFEKTGAR